MTQKTNHPCHHEELVRLNRAIGQLNGVKRMIEEQSYCPDILVQTRAVRSAIKALEKAILKRHLEHCVAAAFENPRAKDRAKDRAKKITELLEIFEKGLST